MRLKDSSVQLRGLCPELALGLSIVQWHWPEGFQMVLTSVNDGRHAFTSLHYAGRAADVRSKNLVGVNKHDLADSIDSALGPDFDFILEFEGGANEHYHLEYQPKRRP